MFIRPTFLFGGQHNPALYSCSLPDYVPGEYQMGELQARSWTVAGTSFKSGRPDRTAS